MIPKFRAWHNEKKKMCEVKGISYPFRMLSLFSKGLYVEVLSASFDDVIIMQSTGLFDKNGVEIFEGDVIRFTSVLGEDEIRQVTFENGCFGIMLERVHIGFGMIKILSEVEYSLEIIGNIYENTELVQQETA